MEVVENEASEFLTWQSADRSRTVRLRHDLIRHIHIEIMRGFGVTRRRGTEPGGVLLGHVENDAVVVDGFEVVPCAYSFGPSYILSPEEQPLFAEAVAKAGPRAIGFFRSHTRNGLTLDPADVDLFAKHLDGAGRLALVLKPFATKPAEASLFFVDSKGRLRAGESPHVFPFSPKIDSVVAEPDPVPKAEPKPVRASLPPVPLSREHEKVLSGVLGLRGPARPETVEQPPAVDDPPPVRRRAGFVTALLAVLFTAAALTTGFVAGVQVAGGRVSISPPAVQRIDPAAGFILGLRAVTAGDRVRLTWATDSPAARQATGATLYIREGAEARVVPLRPEEVRDGSVLHLPQEALVRFRLELNLRGDRTVTEAVEWKR